MTSALGPILKEAEENPAIRQMYVKSNCRKCIGRGEVTLEIPGAYGFTEVKQLCDCVVRTIKRELDNNHG